MKQIRKSMEMENMQAITRQNNRCNFYLEIVFVVPHTVLVFAELQIFLPAPPQQSLSQKLQNFQQEFRLEMIKQVSVLKWLPRESIILV